MTGWAALAVFYVVALAIASGVMVNSVRAARTRPETRTALPGMFPWLEQQRTYANTVSIIRYARDRPPVWGVIVFAGAPTIAALLVSLLGSDEASLGSVLGRLALWGDGVEAAAALTTYGVILAVFVIVSAVYLRVVDKRPDPTPENLPAVMRGRSRPAVWARLLGGTVVDEGGTLEEIGWRAFALPVLLVTTGSIWLSTLIVAVAWWAWHLPREVPALLRSPDWGRFVVLQGQFVLLCLALSVLMTEAWQHTASVWPAVLIHGGTNVWSKAIGGPMWARAKADVRTWIVVALALVVAVVELLG